MGRHSEPRQTPGDEEIVRRFHRLASRFYLLNIVVLALLAALLFAGWKQGWYREAFFTTTFLFLAWLFNAGRLLRCPACGEIVRSKEGLARMPRRCDHCGVKLGSE
ncbi:MAG: hypothetical protein WBN40_06235 [Pseudomonadales bacterium]